MCVVLGWAYVHMSVVTGESRGGPQIPWSWTYRRLWGAKCGWSELNSGPLPEQQAITLSLFPDISPFDLPAVSCMCISISSSPCKGSRYCEYWAYCSLLSFNFPNILLNRYTLCFSCFALGNWHILQDFFFQNSPPSDVHTIQDFIVFIAI